MLRVFGFLIALLAAAPAFAGPQEDLRKRIRAEDIAGAEALMRQMHEAARESRDYGALQNVNATVFMTTDPEVIAFLENWMAAEPDSPYALTGWFWNRQHVAFILRGDRWARQTPRGAMQAFHAELAAGATAALEAYPLAPDYLPASDAMLQLYPSLGEQIPFDRILRDAMAQAPNLQTLRNAIWARSPNWGGSVQEVLALCRDYAGLVADYDAELCLTEAALRYKMPQKMRDAAWEVVWSDDDPRFDDRRLAMPAVRKTAALWEGETLLARHRAMLPQALDMSGFETSARVVAEASGHPEYLAEAQAAFLARAEEALQRDPYNPRFLRIKVDALRGDDLMAVWPGEALPEARRLWADMLIYGGIDAETWMLGGNLAAGHGRISSSLDALPFYANAATLAVYPLGPVTAIFSSLHMDWQLARQLEEKFGGPVEGYAAEPAEVAARLECPMLRAARQVEEMCRRAPANTVCDIGYEAVTQVLADELVAQSCPEIASAPMQTLAYGFTEITAIPAGGD